MQKTASAIDLQDVGLRRGDTWILRDINWSVPAGACVAILGPNGSGKSSLTRILACHIWPTEGSASILGHQMGDAYLPEVRKSVRLVQPAGPYDVDAELCARDVVLTGYFGTIGLYETATDEQLSEANQLLQQVGLSRVADHVYSTLSSGERVRALIARALVQRPRLLLLDEPTAGLDLLAREQVLGVVQRLFDEPDASPPTTVMISHHVEELPPATTHVLLLSPRGGAAAIGTPEEVIRSEVLSAVYGCPLEVRQSRGRYYIEVHPQGWDALLRHDAKSVNEDRME